MNRNYAERAAEILSTRANTKNATLLCILDLYREGFISVANLVYSLTKSKYFGYLAEDVFPSRNWLKNSLIELKNSGGLLAFNDGKWAGQLASFGLCDRALSKLLYGNKFFYNGYKSHFADKELSRLAMSLGRYHYNPQIIMMEIDYLKDKKTPNENDKSLFLTRMRKLKETSIFTDKRPFDNLLL